MFSLVEDGHEARRKQDNVGYHIKGITSQLIRNPGRDWTVSKLLIRGLKAVSYYVDPGIQDESKYCLKMLLRRQFLLLTGVRMSGKMTRLFWLKRELEAKGYQVI
jgi:hypothetical protein